MRAPPPAPPRTEGFDGFDMEKPARQRQSVAAPAGIDPVVYAAFQQYDKDNSGAISREEALDMIKVLELPVSDNYVQRTWDAYDADQSGVLELEEFAKMMNEGIFRNALKSIKTPQRVAGASSRTLPAPTPILSPAPLRSPVPPPAPARAPAASIPSWTDSTRQPMKPAVNAPQVVDNPLAQQPPPVAQRPASVSILHVNPQQEGLADSETPTEALFNTVDSDGTGMISFQEFAAFWSERHLATTGTLDKSALHELERVWRRVDRDKSGELDQEEFAHVIETIAASEWEQRYDVETSRGYFIHRVTGERRERLPEHGALIKDFMVKNKIDVQPRRRKLRVLPFSQSHTTLEQDVDDWDFEIGHAHLAFRVKDERALDAHRIGSDIMWTRCSWFTSACCCVGDGSAKAFLAAKDGPPGIVSYPGWLGALDLAIFAAGVPPVLLGFFEMGGDYQTMCCFAGFLFIPHYLNDFFCYQGNVVKLVFQQAEAKLILFYNFGKHFQLFETACVSKQPHHFA